MSEACPNDSLSHYVNTGSEPAFRQVVEQNLALVLATAKRIVNGDEALAHDIAQVVFTDLAKKAASLSKKTNVSCWLYRHTAFVARKSLRSETRRRQREHKGGEMMIENAQREHLWNHMQPVIDQSMAQLSHRDRNAIVLRFFKRLSLAQLATELGISESAAQKRVQRALARLKTHLERNGIHTSAVLLTSSLVFGGESQAHSLPPNVVDHVAFSTLQGRCEASSVITMFAHLKAAGAGAVVALTCSAVSHPFITTDHLNSSSALTNVRNEEIVSLLGDRGAFDMTIATLPSIVRELRRLAMRPKTRQSTRQLSALLGQVEAKDYEAMALQLTSHGMERAVWHRIQPLLFPLWCRYDTNACLSFGLQASRSHVDAENWLMAIKQLDGEQLVTAKTWYLDRARNEKDNVQWDLRCCVKMGASLAIKDHQSLRK